MNNVVHFLMFVKHECPHQQSEIIYCTYILEVGVTS